MSTAVVKKISTSPNDSIQQQSTQYTSTHLQSTGYSSTLGTRSAAGGHSEMGGTINSKMLRTTNSSMGGGTFGSYIQDHLRRMYIDIEETTRRLEMETRRLHKLDHDLDTTEREYETKKQRHKNIEATQQDSMGQKMHEKRLFEKRLEKAIADLNKGACENEQLREQIDQLREERKLLDTVFKKLQMRIKENASAQKDLLNGPSDNNDKEKKKKEDKKSIVKAKVERNDKLNEQGTLQKVLERERKQFQGDIQKLKRDLEIQSVVAKEQELTAAKEARMGKGRNRKAFMVADEEEAFSETRMHRRILKLSFLNTIQRRHIKQHQKNIEVFEQAFATIKSTTGISDIEEIVKIFIGLEQRNFSLLTYVNQLNNEIETVEKQNRELRGQLDVHQTDQNKADSLKESAMRDLMMQISRTRGATTDKDKQVEESKKTLDEIRPIIHNTVKLMKKKHTDLFDMAYSGDAPPMRASPPDEDEEDLNKLLMYIEEALMQFRVSLPPESARKKNEPPAKASSAGLTFKRPVDLPVAKSRLDVDDDSDDDLETILENKVLTKSELRDRAQESIKRRRKKPGAAGKIAHQDKTKQDSADVGEEQNVEASKRETTWQPAKTDGNLDFLASQMEKVLEDADDAPQYDSRGQLWWRNKGQEKKK